MRTFHAQELTSIFIIFWKSLPVLWILTSENQGKPLRDGMSIGKMPPSTEIP